MIISPSLSPWANQHPWSLGEERRAMSQPAGAVKPFSYVLTLLSRAASALQLSSKPYPCPWILLVPAVCVRMRVVALRSTRSFVSNIPAVCCNTDLVKHPKACRAVSHDLQSICFLFPESWRAEAVVQTTNSVSKLN